MSTKRFSGVGLACLGILMFTALGWAKTYHFASTRVDPSAMGDVDVSKDKNGNEVVSLRVEHLAKPTMLTPPSAMYVVWFQQTGSDPENEGQIKVGDDLRGQFKATTPLHSFDIFVTAETDPTSKTPSDQVLLQARVQE